MAVPSAVVADRATLKPLSGILSDVVVARACRVTVLACSSTLTNDWSQLMVTGTKSLSVIFTLITAGPPCR